MQVVRHQLNYVMRIGYDSNDSTTIESDQDQPSFISNAHIHKDMP